MRATIDSTGTLTIVPESEIEAYALRCYHEKFKSDTPPAICFAWEKIHTSGDARPAKASAKPSQFWPFNQEETAQIRLGAPVIVKANGED